MLQNISQIFPFPLISLEKLPNNINNVNSSITHSTRTNFNYLYLFLIIFHLFIPFSNSEPMELRIAGLFPLSGYLSPYGPSAEASVRLCIENLNSNLLLNNNLININNLNNNNNINNAINNNSSYQISFSAYDTMSSAKNSYQSFIYAKESFNMYGLIGCHDNFASQTVALTSSLFYIPQVSYGSRANFLNDQSIYPFFTRVIPSYSKEGKCLAAFIHLFGYRNIGVILSADDYGIPTSNLFSSTLHYFDSLSNNNTRNNNNKNNNNNNDNEEKELKITMVQFTSGEERLDTQFEALRNALVRVIVMFPSSVNDAQTILKEADRYHMIGDNFVWIGGSFTSSSNLFFNSTTNTTNHLIKSLAKGMISLQLKGGFGSKFEQFLDQWEKLNPQIYSGSGKRSIPLYGAYAYDAMELFVRAFLLDPFASVPELIRNIENISFEGITGFVSLNGTNDRSGIFNIVNLRESDEGDKGWVVIGDWFELFSFLPSSSSFSISSSSLDDHFNNNNNHNNKLNSKLNNYNNNEEKDYYNYYSNETIKITRNFGFHFNYSIEYHDGSNEPPQMEVRPEVTYWECKNRKFNTDKSGKIKLDPPGPKAKLIADHYFCDNFIDCENFSDESGNCKSSNYNIVFIIFGISTAILILFAILLIPFIIFFGFIKRDQRVRSASPPFLLVIIISIIIGYSSIYAWFGMPNKIGCGFQPWLLGLSLNSMIAGLIAKNIRIFQIFKYPTVAKKHFIFRDHFVFIIYILIMIPSILILFLWTLISTPTAHLKKIGDHNYDHYICDTGGFTGPPGGLIFFFIFVSYSAILLLFGALISFAIRKVSNSFNESKLIAISIYNILILSIFIIPIFMVLLTFNPFIGWVIRSLAILYAFTTTLVLLFIPKLIGVISDRVSLPLPSFLRKFIPSTIKTNSTLSDTSFLDAGDSIL